MAPPGHRRQTSSAPTVEDVTTAHAGHGGLEVLTFGGSHPDPSRFALGWLRIVLVLLGGMLLGAWTGAEVAERTNPPVLLAAGSLREVAGCSPGCLELALLNAGKQDVTVVPVAMGQGRIPAGSDEVVAEPGSWSRVLLDAPVTCELPRPAPATTVTLRVSTGSTVRLITLPLTTGVDVPALRHDRFCPTGQGPEPRDLHGWWLRDDAAEQPSNVAGSSRIRFGADGSFAVWAVDRVHGPHLVVRGRYHLAGRLLTLSIPLQAGCTHSPTATWRTTLVGRDGLHLARTGGTGYPCVVPPSDTWTAHRVETTSVR